MASGKWRLAEPRIRVAPSLLAADFWRLADQVAQLEAGGAEILHLDVMDGHFVPNISFGVPVIEKLRPRSKLFFDTHLMITDPARYAEAFVKAGSDHLTFHIEATSEPFAVADQIHALGASAGITLNPSTPASAIRDVIRAIDMVLVMSVWPGFGGQRFIAESLEKAGEIKKWLRSEQRLEIDGGIDPETVGGAAEAGVDTFVAGSAVFGRPDPVSAMHILEQIARKSRPDTAIA